MIRSIKSPFPSAFITYCHCTAIWIPAELFRVKFEADFFWSALLETLQMRKKPLDVHTWLL